MSEQSNNRKALMTIWGETLDKEHVLPEYPRPQLIRKAGHRILNGEWEYAFTKTGESLPLHYDGKILVPFSPECVLSGVMRQLQPDEYLWYRRSVTLQGPSDSCADRVLLHFGAVDQSCIVFINGKKAGEHTGGYLPFSFDITELTGKEEQQLEIVVRVRDLSDTSWHARGKQKLKSGGMFYTAVSGIWQSVWLEWAPEKRVESILADWDGRKNAVRISVLGEGISACRFRIFSPALCTGEEDNVRAPEDAERFLENEIAACDAVPGETAVVSLPVVRLWSQDAPWLYYCRVSVPEGDEVISYFALRSFTLEKEGRVISPPALCSQEDGPESGSKKQVKESREKQAEMSPDPAAPRICLNHQVQFQYGVLDQGYWPDGIYTPPSEEALLFEIAGMKEFGFNMVRKHIKIETERWYYHCDRLGIAVWQDMVCGGGPLKSWYVTYLATLFTQIRMRISDRHLFLQSRTKQEGREEFEKEMLETIARLRSHPSIAAWVIFNEGWGQFETQRLTELARRTDPSRLIDQASGWFDQGGGDFRSIHHYFFRLLYEKEDRRGLVLSECGGFPWMEPGHSMDQNQYGYGKFKSQEEMNGAFTALMDRIRELEQDGFCAVVYTQWSDVEGEVNGIWTYDRKVRKIGKTGGF